jgi:hypothetical protein
MKMRMAIATFSLVVGAMALSACGRDDTATKPAATAASAATSSVTPSATVPATISTSADLVGDWEDVDAEWTVHFKDDGTFVEDFEGVKDFRVGEYALSGDEVSLIGGDGNTDKRVVEGQSLKFKLGTLTRK